MLCLLCLLIPVNTTISYIIHSDKNPVFTYNETVLYEEMERIKEEVGDPITVFLTSEEYQSASCAVLDPSDDDDDDDDGDDDPTVRLKYIQCNLSNL